LQGPRLKLFAVSSLLKWALNGVRVVCLRGNATPDNPVLDAVFTELAKVQGITKEEIERAEVEGTALKRLSRLAEIGNAAVMMASDYASSITATAANITCGNIVD
jgi:3-oxoacyl-[acyl-carrier protein] reductase